MDKTDSPKLEQIATTWISYQVWSSNQPGGDASAWDELRRQDAEADQHGFWAFEAVEDLVRERPEDGWSMVLRLVALAPDERVLAAVAAGPLENLLCFHSYAFIDRVEIEARRDSKLRRCLSGVWGWDRIPTDVQVRMRRTWEGDEPL